MGTHKAVIVLIVILVVTAWAREDRRRRKHRCRYDRRGVEWSPCDLTLQVKTKVAALVRGHSSCPKTRTYTRPCDDGSILLNGCEYIQVSDWSNCDPVTRTSTRTLELTSGDTKICDNNRVESKECSLESAEKGNDKKDKESGQKRSRVKGRRRKRLRKKQRRRKKTKTEVFSECRYQRDKWSDCDQRTGLQTTVQKLKSTNSTTKCELTVTITRQCMINLDKAKGARESGERKKQRKKDRRDREKTRKKKGKKDKKKLKRNKKKKVKDEISTEPPRLIELHVVPYTTFAVVSWQPPQPNEFGQHIPVDSYQIGYGRDFPDIHTVRVNASEVTYRIENLEPGRQYIVSIRAENRMGVGQALYETIMTRDAEGASPVILPPLGMRPNVLSSEAINVSWVDMSAKGEGNNEKRVYYLRYRQLNHLSGGSPYQNRFSVQKTTDTYLVVKNLEPHTKYEFAVMASDGDRNSTWSVMVWNITQEAAPTTSPEDLTVIIDPDSPGQVILSWQPPSRPNGIITGYQVSYSTLTSEGIPRVEKVDIEGNKLSVTLNYLIPGVTYELTVRAKNNQGTSPPLTISDYQLPGDPAPVPATLRAQPILGNPTAVTLIWEVPDDVTSNILGFVILYTTNIETEEVHWTVELRVGKDLNTAVVENLKAGKKYYFKIQARTSVGYGAESNTVQFETPVEDKTEPPPIEPPKELQVIVLSSTSAVLSWKDPGLARIFEEDVVLPASTYTVRYRTLDPSPSEYTLISPPFTSLYLVDLMPLTRYEFSVKVHRGDQESEWSSPVMNTTFAADFSQLPLIAEVRGQPQSPQVVVLSWQPHSDSKIKEYVVMYSSDRRKPHKHWIQKAAVNQDVRQQIFYNLKPDTTYFFFIQAMTDLGFGPRSKVVSYTTPNEDEASPHLHNPENLQVMIVSSSSAVVSWHDPSMVRGKDKGVERAHMLNTYTLRYRDIGNRSGGYRFISPSSPSIFVVDLRPATQYEFSVRMNKGGHHSEWSSPVVNTTFEAAPSSAPTNVTVKMDGRDPTTAYITWNPPKQANGEITGYMVHYETSTMKSSAAVQVGDRYHRVPFLQPHTLYKFRVGSKNNKGAGPLSDPVAYRTPKVKGPPPTDVTVVPSTDDPYRAVVNWQPPSPYKRKVKYYTVTHFTEERKHHTVERVPGSELTTMVKKLMPSTTYHFTVQAHYRRGAGPHSATVKYSIPKELL